MASKRMRRTRWAVALTAVIVIGAGAAALGFMAAPRPAIHSEGFTWKVTTSSLVYTFDAAWRFESIHHRRGQSLSLERQGEERLRLRRVLLDHLGLARLDDIPQAGQAEMDSLRSLGYL